MEEESEDVDIIARIVIIIIVILLAFIFRNQIYDICNWIFCLIQEKAIQ